MKRYIRIVKRILYLNILELTAYRANFINNILSDFIWGIFSFLSIFLLTTNITEAYGWSRNEILLLTTLYTIFMGFFHTFLSGSLDTLAETIYLGKLDPILLKPVDSQFSVSVRYISYTNFFRILFGTTLSIYFLHQLHIVIQPIMLVNYLILALCGLIVLYSIWFFFITFTIWNPRLSNMLDLLYNTGSISRYPQEMYKHIAGYVFLFLLPMTLIINTPTKALLGKITLFEEFQLFAVSLLLFMASRKFWQFALRSYSSGGN